MDGIIYFRLKPDSTVLKVQSTISVTQHLWVGRWPRELGSFIASSETPSPLDKNYQLVELSKTYILAKNRFDTLFKNLNV